MNGDLKPDKLEAAKIHASMGLALFAASATAMTAIAAAGTFVVANYRVGGLTVFLFVLAVIAISGSALAGGRAVTKVGHGISMGSKEIANASNSRFAAQVLLFLAALMLGAAAVLTGTASDRVGASSAKEREANERLLRAIEMTVANQDDLGRHITLELKRLRRAVDK